MSNRRGYTASDFRNVFAKIRDDYDRVYGPSIAEFRRRYAAPTRMSVDEEKVLEAHVRTYVIDGLLTALRWTIVPSGDGDGANMIPEAQIDPADGPRRYMDYLGYENEVDKPLIVVEAKRPSDFPIPATGSTNTLAAVVSNWLKKPEEAPTGWSEWLPSLQNYVQSVALRSQVYPVRAVITDGNWLVIFANPKDAFGDGGAREARYIHVSPSYNDVLDRYEDVFGLLDQREVSRSVGEIPPGAIAGVVSLDRINTVTHGLRLKYATVETIGDLAPTITVMPIIVLGSDTGAWFRVSRGANQETHFFPRPHEPLSVHLETIKGEAQQLLRRVYEQLGREIPVSGLREHYARPSFEAMNGIERVPGREDHFWIVTGEETHFLLPPPTDAACGFHTYAGAKSQNLNSHPIPILVSRVDHPRSYFTDGAHHHCCHEDVSDKKLVSITENNLDRCGARSGRLRDAYCEIAPFEKMLCCRLCAFNDVCASNAIFQLPCTTP